MFALGIPFHSSPVDPPIIYGVEARSGTASIPAPSRASRPPSFARLDTAYLPPEAPASGGMKMKPTVGRLSDPRSVGRPTHSRFFRRPTVGRFLPSSEALAERAGWRAFLPSMDGAGSLQELYYLCPRSEKAQMAESVDALVSNTNGRKFVPVRSRLWVQSVEISAL